MQDYDRIPGALPRWLQFRPVWFWVPAVLLVALRFLHFGELIDEPHSWRQCDTAEYAYSFYKGESSLLRPEVNWMGGHATILEFPLHEVVTAFLYRVFWPSHVWCRVVTLLFFLGSAHYLHRIVRLVSTETHAHLATLLYLAMPLGLFYSRALHIDFTAVCLAHGMLYHWMQAVRQRRQIHWLLGAVCATFAFPVKAPYAFYLALPLLAFVLHERSFKYALRNLAWVISPLVLFVLWQRHVEHTNAQVPDFSPWVADFHRFVSERTFKWYFGTWEQRMNPQHWELIWLRFRDEIAGGSFWVWLLIPALLAGLRRFSHHFFRLWWLGTLIYVAIFFNLNWVHNYYQIPLMAITAILLGGLLAEVQELLNGLRAKAGTALAMLALVAFGTQQVRYAERHYYQVNTEFPHVGAVVAKLVQEGSKVIIVHPSSDARTPMYLYHSHRQGWQMNELWLSVASVNGLVGQGATHLVSLRHTPLPDDLRQYLARCPIRTWALRPNMGIQVFDLAPLHSDSSLTHPAHE